MFTTFTTKNTGFRQNILYNENKESKMKATFKVFKKGIRRAEE